MIVTANNLASAEALTPEQAAVLFPALSVNYLQKLRLKGNGPAYSKPTGNRVIYRRADIEAWLSASRVRSTSDGR